MTCPEPSSALELPVRRDWTRLRSPSTCGWLPKASNPIVDDFTKLSHIINQSRQRLRDAAKDAARLLNRSRLPMGRKQIQKKLAIGFKEALLPPKLEALLGSRFCKHFASLCTDGFAPHWEQLLACVKAAQPYYVMLALKTLLNTWCTQGPYHDCSADLCIFGCAGAVDDISHYACCQRLWQASAEAAQMPLSASVEERLLLLYPARERPRDGYCLLRVPRG